MFFFWFDPSFIKAPKSWLTIQRAQLLPQKITYQWKPPAVRADNHILLFWFVNILTVLILRIFSLNNCNYQLCLCSHLLAIGSLHEAIVQLCWTNRHIFAVRSQLTSAHCCFIIFLPSSHAPCEEAHENILCRLGPRTPAPCCCAFSLGHLILSQISL